MPGSRYSTPFSRRMSIKTPRAMIPFLAVKMASSAQPFFGEISSEKPLKTLCSLAM